MTGSNSPPVLARAVEVTRHFGDVAALDGVSLEVPAGQLVGLLGPNGAGKTTLLSLLTGLRKPSSGRVELFGGDPRDALRRRSLGSTPQETGLPATLRVGRSSTSSRVTTGTRCLLLSCWAGSGWTACSDARPAACRAGSDADSRSRSPSSAGRGS